MQRGRKGKGGRAAVSTRIERRSEGRRREREKGDERSISDEEELAGRIVETRKDKVLAVVLR